jgi:hypothetical protein
MMGQLITFMVIAALITLFMWFVKKWDKVMMQETPKERKGHGYKERE